MNYNCRLITDQLTGRCCLRVVSSRCGSHSVVSDEPISQRCGKLVGKTFPVLVTNLVLKAVQYLTKQ